MQHLKFRTPRTTRHGKGFVYSFTDKGMNRLGWFFSNYHIKAGYKIDQYTGLQDKHGVDIYEGDIVKRYDSHYLIEWTTATYSENPQYHPMKKNGECYNRYYGDWDLEEFTVVGNIYENPELLE